MKYALGLICVLFLSCTKKGVDPPPYPTPVDSVKSLLAKHVPNMQGSRTWSHTFHSVQNSGEYDTTITYADTVFSIEVQNDSTISFLGRTLHFSRTVFWNGTGDSVNLYEYLYFTKAPAYHKFETAYYFYHGDSIQIDLQDGSMGGRWTHTYRSKK